MRKLFTRLFGNDDTKHRISELILNSSLPHALMITGPLGSGKHTLAAEIAAALNCENKGSEQHPFPCGACRNCKRIYSKNFPDVSYLKRKPEKATIGVEEVRDFRDDMFLSATEAHFKVYIIEEADFMTKEAQNALLKVLEEPPLNVHIILLCCESDNILTTIKSRAQAVQTEIFDKRSIYDYLISTSEAAGALRGDALDGIIASASGVIGKALMFLDENRADDINERRKLVLSFISAMPKKAPFLSLFTLTSSFPKEREELRLIFELISMALRDIISAKISDDIEPIFFISKDEINEIADSFSKNKLCKIYDIITDAITDLDKNVNISVLLADISVKIKEA